MEEQKRKSGGQFKPIDWKKVDQLLISGCKGTEIAAHFGLHKQTFYNRLEQEYGMSYTDYSYQMHQKGDSLIRHEQFCKALGIKKDGDNTMLIWLGKNRLGQREGDPKDAETPNDALLKELIDALKSKADPKLPGSE